MEVNVCVNLLLSGIPGSYKNKFSFFASTSHSPTVWWKESCDNTLLRSPPVAQCDEALRNSSSLYLLGPAPPPGSTDLAAKLMVVKTATTEVHWHPHRSPQVCLATTTITMSSHSRSGKMQEMNSRITCICMFFVMMNSKVLSTYSCIQCF